MAPVYAAILALLSLALIAFVATLLPEKYIPPALRTGQGEASPASQSVETGLRVGRDPPQQRSRGTWM